jgi:hypothetical protein
MALYNAYRIVRQGGEDHNGDRPRVRYFVQRPDGSECCRDVTWGEAERAIQRDMRANGWPADSLPTPRGDGHGQDRHGPGHDGSSASETRRAELSSKHGRRASAGRSASRETAE